MVKILHIHTLPILSGIDLNKFQPVSSEEKKQARSKLGIAPDARVAGIVSKLCKGRGHSLLLKAFSELKKDLKNALLIIVGEGHLENDLRKHAKDLKLEDSVIFTGITPDVPDVMACFDFFVAPSFFKGVERVIIEAMAMELPVVASNEGGISDIVKNNINGYLVSPGNITELKEAMKDLLTNQRLSVSMGKNGRLGVTGAFSSDAMKKNRYNDCLKRKGLSNNIRPSY